MKLNKFTKVKLFETIEKPIVNVKHRKLTFEIWNN